jgi:hypothetical protein
VRRGAADHRNRGTLAVFAASALHGLVLLALVLTPVRRRTPQVIPPVAPDSPPLSLSIDIDVDSEVEAPAEDAPPHREGEVASAVTPAHEPVRAPATDFPSPSAPAGPAEAAPDAPPVIVSMIAPAPRPAIGLALGAPNRFVDPGAREQPSGPSATEPLPARTQAEAKRAVETALREPARKRERELGLGPEGPVLQALGDATSASSAPVKGRAVFRAVADGTGMIVGIEVMECDGGRAGWADAAELARRALQGKKLRMPSTATLAEMRIEIVSEWKMPSGHDPGTDVSVLGLPVAKGEGKKSTKIDILDPIPKIEMVELAPDVKIPVPQINLRIVAVQGDPADIGAKPRRVVHTRLLDSKVL